MNARKVYRASGRAGSGLGPGRRQPKPGRGGKTSAPLAKTSARGWRLLLFVIVAGLAIGIALAARHSSGGQR